MFSAVRSQSYLRSQGFLRAYHQVQSSLNTLICARVSLRTGPLVEDGANKESGKKKERTERTMGKGSDAPAPAPFPPRLRLLLVPFGRGQTLLAGALFVRVSAPLRLSPEVPDQFGRHCIPYFSISASKSRSALCL